LERVWNSESIKANIIRCDNCGFIFCNPRLDKSEEKSLYKGYRDQDYQKQRMKYEKNYTEEINALIGKNPVEMKNRKENLLSILNSNLDLNKFENILDFGGDKGQHISDIFCHMDKYVFDLSDVSTVEGVKKIEAINESENKKFDLITCCHVLEHVSSPIDVINQIKSFSHKNTVFYFEVPYEVPFDGPKTNIIHYILKKIIFFNCQVYRLIRKITNRDLLLMHEHVNFFSVNSLQNFLEKEGFEIIFIQMNEIDFKWSKFNIVSCLAKLK
jgi:hypothetical protein